MRRKREREEVADSCSTNSIRLDIEKVLYTGPKELSFEEPIKVHMASYDGIKELLEEGTPKSFKIHISVK